MAANHKKQRLRSDYPFFLSYRTRWSDNDQYAHVNNAIYYHLFDAVVNNYLIDHCGMDPTKSEQIGLVVSSFCEFFSPVSFPDVLDLGLRVTHLGSSSVTYEVGVFRAKAHTNEDHPASTHLQGKRESNAPDTVIPVAVGGYTHVFVESTSRKSTPINAQMKSSLKKLMAHTDATAVSKL
ncbi:HotDog domain-containing protein [Scleroderma yunnanense]